LAHHRIGCTRRLPTTAGAQYDPKGPPPASPPALGCKTATRAPRQIGNVYVESRDHWKAIINVARMAHQLPRQSNNVVRIGPCQARLLPESCRRRVSVHSTGGKIDGGAGPFQKTAGNRAALEEAGHPIADHDQTPAPVAGEGIAATLVCRKLPCKTRGITSMLCMQGSRFH